MQIIVLGMHRSGTSCVTRLINMMGAYFGLEGVSTGKSKENPRGFWERRDIRIVCDQLLRGAGAEWWRVSGFSVDRIPGKVKVEARARFAEVVRELDANCPWVIKEPRLCLVFPVLRPQLETPVCVHVYRVPVEVAGSLRTRNGFTISSGLALWEFYSRSAINASRGLPRLLISYEDVVSDPIGAVGRLHEQLTGLGVTGLHLPPDADVVDFIDDSLRRERSEVPLGTDYLSRPQAELAAAFEDGGILELDEIPPLSEGAREALAEDEALSNAPLEVHDLRRDLDKAQSALAAKDSRISSLEHELNLIVNSKRYVAGTTLAQLFHAVIPGFAKPAILKTVTTFYFTIRRIADTVRRGLFNRSRRRHSRRQRDDRKPDAPSERRIYPFPAPAVLRSHLEQLRVDIIVCVHGSLEDVKRCLSSVERTRLPSHRLIVVDDGSDAETRDFLEQHVTKRSGDLLIRHRIAQGYTIAANAGLRAATGGYVILLNSDTIVAGDWVLKVLECGESAEDIGIVGPMSNAASWQSLPDRFDGEGDWAVNPLPQGFDVGHMAQLVELQSDRVFPRVPLINGFCLAIKRAVLDTIGLFDEEAFPHGYGEENDFCIRATDAGFACAIATHAFVFHAKSRSYSHEQRRELSKQGSRALCQKYSAEHMSKAVEGLRDEVSLARLRERITHFIRRTRPQAPEAQFEFSVLFILPVKSGAGGAHSVIQEVMGLRRLGVYARAAVPAKYKATYVLNYNFERDMDDILLPYDSETDLTNRAAGFAVCVATIFNSVDVLSEIVHLHPHVLPAYYVQDYEPLFFERGNPNRAHAEKSYTTIPNAVLFAKTQWLCRTVEQYHGVRVQKVIPSLDQDVYYPPAVTSQSGPVKVAAMVRVRTPRRGPIRTMRVLRRLSLEYGHSVEVHIFGTSPDDLAQAGLMADFSVQTHGVLPRASVAEVLRQSDVFVDFSDYQAFGRTGLEAMACGNAVILPQKGGTDEYARDRQNTLLVNTGSDDECYRALSQIIDDRKMRAALTENALTTASQYSIHRAAMSELILFKSAWEQVHRPPVDSHIKADPPLLGQREPAEPDVSRSESGKPKPAGARV